MDELTESEEQFLKRVVQHLEQSEHRTRERRAARFVIASKLPQVPSVLVGRFEQLHLLEEAQRCFIEGLFASTVIVAFSVIEHSLDEESGISQGKTSADTKRKGPLQLCRDAGLVSQELLHRAYALRDVRNALIHYRPSGDSSSVIARSSAQGKSPFGLLEEDAREALLLSREIFIATLRSV